MKEYKLFITGKWIDGHTTKEQRSPYDGKPFGIMHFGNREQVTKAVDAASLAFEKTRALSSHERASVLMHISRAIEKRTEELAESIVFSSGKSIRSARVEVSRSANTFLIAAEEAKRLGGEIIPLDLIPGTEQRWGFVRRFPLGVIAGITPFNFPLNLVAHKVAPAIATGNSILLRPASQVAVTSAILAEIIAESGYPSGGFNFIPCGYKAADVLVEDERVKKITFTGSPEIGWDIKQKAFKKHVTLELGGNAAVVIEPDTDMDYALQRTLLGAFSYSGQVCISIQRVYLHDSIYDTFLDRFVTATKNLNMGNPLDESTDIGPMINEGAAEQTEEW
ncbi:MAG: aldehyde dehydrogenase family protein, partial [Candidatus Aminicenantes bacterium]|nr:aldehyde dehydrogenase family protein [Candidatus Aminicenantes bacterium]